MSPSYDHDRYDLARVIIKPLYFGMLINITVPAVLTFGCYWLHTNSPMPNRLGDLANPIFFVFAAMALVETVMALWLRRRLLAGPMIRSLETFEQDLTENLLRRLRPVMLVIASISLYGVVYYLLTGRFEAALVIILFSFIVFQVVRPRISSARKLVAEQEKLASAGKFLTS
jgi:hypothetical protein